MRPSHSIAATLMLAIGLISNNGGSADASSATVIATIPVGATPFGIAVTPDGSRVYVSNSTGGSVSVINTSTQSVTSTITSLVGTTPVGISVDATGTYAYVANYASGTVTRITVGSGTTSAIDISATVSGDCNWPLNIALTPNGSTLYVACQDNGRVISAPVSGGSGTGTVWMGAGSTFPTDVALSADGTALVSSLSGSNQAFVIDGSGSSFVSVTAGPYAVAVSPTTGLAYLAGQTSGAISVVNTTTRSTVGSTIAVGGQLSDIAITPDGTTALVAVLDQDAVRVINLGSGEVTGTIQVGDGPQSLTISHDGRYAYTANRYDNTVSVIELESSENSEAAGANSARTTRYTLQLDAGSGGSCTQTSATGLEGTWATLPLSGECAPAAGNRTLLGWSTSAAFPVDIAQRQVDRGWGAYELYAPDGRPTAVFIPAGGAARLTGGNTLHAIWGR